MIIPLLQGGLGNQLFQIASIYGHARQNNFEFAINPSYNLNHTTPHDVKSLYTTIFSKVPKIDYLPDTEVREKHFHYAPLSPTDNARYVGYFQSSKYFSLYREELRCLISLDGTLATKDALTYPQKRAGIHIRLGDYVPTNPTHNYHLVCSSYYYQMAAHRLLALGYKDLVICSDNPAQASKLLGNIPHRIFIGETNLQDLYFLAHCDALILSNSSFSWWSCYLGKPKEIVLCPDRWFAKDGPKDFHDIFESGWVLLPTQGSLFDWLRVPVAAMLRKHQFTNR